MARFLIVGEHERSDLLADALERQGHVASVVPIPERGSLEHVAIVCWLVPSSPESFLLGSIDSSMRGLLYEATLPRRSQASDGASLGGAGSKNASDAGWEQALLGVAARNAIPVAALRADPGEPGAWLVEALEAIAALIEGPGRSEAPAERRARPVKAPDAPF